MKSKKTSIIVTSLITVLVFSIGFLSGRGYSAEASNVSSKIPSYIAGAKTSDGPESASKASFDLFWKAWNILDDKYVDTKNATTSASKKTSQDRVYGAVQGMVASLGDPYTMFFTPEEATVFESQIDGNFEGVGMELGTKDGVLTVISALKASPAEKAGIRSGDKILKVDNTITVDLAVEQAVKLIRGKKGTTVKITVGRENSEPIEISIVRDVIDLPTLDTKYDQKTGIFTIKLYSFSAQSSTLFRNALRDFVATGSNKLILDVRGNPGGYLDSAVDMASWFLPAGKVVVREDYGSKQPEAIEKSKGYNIFSDKLRMVVLIDNGSASASEILAGALSEYKIATLVGTRTFGKGSVQEFMKLDKNTALKVTVARWLTPNGLSISDGGLTPDIEVKLTQDDVKNLNDLQMQKAIELLK